ncbi:MAG: bacteriocin-protection protein [Gemmatimonadetes bacterium RBG_16_66_8]|nr:MAG: bacteriocin-protection protein [Gemmatimonadetes bacterium RBG_16_66_8]
MKPRFFATPAKWRAWLAANHASADELWVGFYKKASGRPSITWPESVDEALCYGWIDGVRRSVDADRYMIRFTPRREGSTWSAVNVRRANELIRLRRMRAAGLREFEKRQDENSGIYSFEQRKALRLPPAYARALRANGPAWKFFQGEAPSYRRTATFWVISAKREETKLKRLKTLVEDSARGQRIGPLRRP